MNLSQKIDVIDYQKNPLDFEKHYLKTQTPVIIKGLTNETGAVKIWSLSYFKITMCDILLDIYDNGNSSASA